MHWLEELAVGKHKMGYLPTAQVKEALARKPPYVAGSDEVGYGALAGPLVVCAVLAPYDWMLEGLKDSKEFRDKKEEMEDLVAKLYQLDADTVSRRPRIHYFLVDVPPARVDELGVGEALRRAHEVALEHVSRGFDALCVADGSVLRGKETVLSIVQADSFVPQVMAASVIAKHARDSYMKDVATKFPGYGFEEHVGYPTPEHKEALARLGPCAIHRKSYSPVKESMHGTRHAEDGRDPTQVTGKPEQVGGAAGDGREDLRPDSPPGGDAGGKPHRKARGRRRKAG